MRIDSAGNLGLGVTPSAWRSNTPAFQIGSAGVCLFADSGVTAEVGNNVFLNSSSQYIYLRTDAASRYRQYQGVHSWLTAASGTAGNAISFTTAMTLDASGNLGIGTTSIVDISGGSGKTLEIYGGSQGGFLHLTNSTTGQTVSDGFIIGTAIGGSDALLIQRENAAMIFRTNDTERARITSGGFFKASNSGTYLSSTASYHELFNNGAGGDWTARFTNSTTTAADAYGITINYTGATPNSTDNSFINATDSSANRFLLRSNGGIANYSANDANLSDRREKTNFAPAGSYLDKICAIPVQTFNYIDQNLETDAGLTLGVVAQDVQAVAPELVTESDWGTQEEPKMRLSIYQTDLQYALMKALQELNAKFEAYKASHP
jgi:hypothetical protein